MGLSIRVFIAEDDDTIKRLPLACYERLHKQDSDERLPKYAGKRVRYFNVPVILPYGNLDSTYKGKIKYVNLLSLASNAQVFSALNQKGKRITGFPYSPLSSGDEQAIYNFVECPHPEDPFKAHLDINNDGYYEYTLVRTGKIAYHDDYGEVAFAPPVLSQKEFAALLAQIKCDTSC